jgi:hypothetical protein
VNADDGSVVQRIEYDEFGRVIASHAELRGYVIGREQHRPVAARHRLHHRSTQHDSVSIS